ncbi:MAG: S8 family serine peptidase [Clostridiales bacterium]|nr:S8 family serine peptidase [Clostridiales bacterium]
MRKLIMILIMICFLSFSYAEESEEMIMVELTDGTYELRPVSQYVSNELGLRTLSVMSDAEKAVINATFDTEIIRATTIVPLRMEVTGQTSNYDSWRFSYVHVNDILSGIETDIADSPIRVAVIDSGINTSLSGEIDIVSGKNFSGGLETDYDDGYGHGSHVAGIIGSKLSGDDIDGIAPGIDIVPIKVFNDAGSGTTATLIAGLEYAISDEADVDVINMSLSYGGTNSIIEDLIAQAETKGIVVVAATANDSNLWLNTSDYNNINIKNNGPTQSATIVTYPAAFETVLAVGSVTKHSTEDKIGISDFSNVAGTRDSINTVVDVVAPGQGIVSWNESDDTTEIMSGTSMATPHVAALAALIKNEYSDLTPSQIRTLIRETAYNPGIEFPTGIQKADETDVTESDMIGQGLMDVKAAYHLHLFKDITFTGVSNYSFDAETLNYTMVIPNDTTAITMSIQKINGTTMTLNGSTITELNQEITITGDETTVTLVGSYGINTKTYTFTINKFVPKLDTASFDDGTTFDVNNLNHNLMFSKDLTDVTLTLTVTDASVIIDPGTAGEVVGISKDYSFSGGDIDTVIELTYTPDNSITSEYHLHLSNDSDGILLSDITLGGAGISEFDSADTSYDLGVLEYNADYSVVGIKSDALATVTYSINGEDYTETSVFTGIPEVTNTIDIKVTKGVYSKIYRVEFNRDDGVDLTALDITPMIDATEQTTTHYTELSSIAHDVLYVENKVTLQPTIEAGGGRVSYKIGSSEFMTTNTLDLEFGINNIVIRVENGTLGEADYTTRDYDLTINRPGSADISAINLTAYSDETTEILLYTSYAYDPDTIDYTLEISDDLNHLKFDVSQVEATSISSIKVNSDTTQTFDSTININLSTGDHVVIVKNEFGTFGQSDYLIKTYTYSIKVVSGTKLSSIYLKADDTDLLTFDPENTTYNLEALTGTTQLKFRAVKANTTYGEMVLTVDGATTDPVTLHPYSDGSEQLIAFDVPSVITLVVDSPIASENKTYTFNITERAMSTDSTLSSLSINGYSLSPTFNPSTLSYSLSVSNSVTSVTVQGTKNSSYASMTIKGSAVSTLNVSLAVGDNAIPVVVTAEDSSQTTYTVTVNRAADASGSSGGSSTPSSGGSPPPPPPPSGTPAAETTPTIPEDEVVVTVFEDGTEKSVVTVSEERVLLDIEDDAVDKVTVIVTSKEAVEVTLTPDILKAVAESNKPLEITYNDVTFKMTPEIIGGLHVEGTLNIVFESVAPTADDQKVVSDIYELDIMDGTRKLDFDIPIPIVLIYDQNKIGNAENLAIYYYSEETKAWVYVGGKLGDNNEISFEARHFTKYAIRENNKTFEDIQTHWAKDAIETLASREITSGISETEFAPNKTLTNAEFVVLLTKVLGLADYDGPLNYSQVHSGDWYEPFFRRAHGAGLLINTFGVQMDPNAPIKREEMASLLMDAYFYYSRTKPEDQLVNAVEFALDEDQVSSHFRQDVRQAYQLQLIVGDDNNLFNPQNGATRAEAAIVIKKLLILLKLL